MKILLTSLTLLLSAACSALVAQDTIQVLPGDVVLTGREARQPLLVERLANGQYVGPVSGTVAWSVSDADVVKIEDGAVLPLKNGEATITAKSGSMSATAKVTVQGMNQPHAWNFRNQVQSIFSKAGCNSGACHGAVAGKNGFRLSLRGYDPEMDFRTITREARGRRIVPSDPGRSLILTKPTGTIPHKGGVRFRADSYEHRVIAEWIASGSPGPSEDDPRLEKLEVLPKQTVLKKGTKQQLLVRAHFSDGHTEDVTRWAKFTSTNLSVAKVGTNGEVEVIGHGEGAVVAWYLSNNVIATVSSPYEHTVSPEVFQQAERVNLIDELVLKKLAALNIPPSPVTSDDLFLRRAFLDTIGVLPTAEEAKAFLDDKSPDKRNQLIEQLLNRPEFVDYWAYKWSDLLLVTGDRLRPEAVKSYYKWIRERVEQNTPWDQFAKQLVTAQGSTFENGAANFYSLHQDPLNMAETVSMAFLGMSIQCARCHDHPLERWTNDDYYGMANLFARVRGKGWGGDFRNGDGNRVVFTVDNGELIQPRTGKPQQPRPLDGAAIPFESSTDRRIHMANWLTAPENPYFSKAITNRVWANFFSVGLVEKVDDLRLTNPPSNPELLQALADYLVTEKYDLKSLMRLILQSSTYQRSSETLPENAADKRFYSHYYPHRLKAEVLLDAISLATAAPTTFKDQKPGTRALQLPDASVASYFLETFGRPERIITCECERSDVPSMVQVLHLVNGDTLNGKLTQKENRIEQQLAANLASDQLIEQAYLATLSRYPTFSESKRLKKLIDETPEKEKRLALEDLYWSLLTSREFLFNH